MGNMNIIILFWKVFRGFRKIWGKYVYMEYYEFLNYPIISRKTSVNGGRHSF